MIHIAEVIAKMMSSQDNEPCPCMSGRLFKNCHKLKIYNEKENTKKLFAELIKIKRNKECLFGQGFDCDGRIIKAHSISKKFLRDIVSADNHVYSFIKAAKSMAKLNELFEGGMLPDPDRIGLNDVTTFNGLCEKHDNNLFECFEKRPFECSMDQIKALHLRPVLKEIFVKTEMLMTMTEAQKSIGKAYDGIIAEEKNALSLIMSLGSELSLRDLYVELGLTRDCILGKIGERLSYICFEINGMCPALCSSTVNPAFDLRGIRIQNYNNEEVFTRSFSFNIVTGSDKYFVLFSWFECDEIDAFFQSLFDRAESNLVQYLAQMPFAFSENMVISIDWYDWLSLIKKERLKKIFYSDIINIDSGKSTSQEFRRSGFVAGKIKKMTSNSRVPSKE